MSRSVRRMMAAGMAASLAYGAGGHAQTTSTSRPRQQAPRHPGTQAVTAPTPAPPAENLVVRGARRYQSAPVPNQSIHDPSEAMRDPATGAPIGRFGRSYIDANPVPPINPELKGDQSPVAVGVQR